MQLSSNSAELQPRLLEDAAGRARERSWPESAGRQPLDGDPMRVVVRMRGAAMPGWRARVHLSQTVRPHLLCSKRDVFVLC
jgi:hypothetical protein